MAFRHWRIGLDIQKEGIRAVALIAQSQGLRLCRWWYLPLLPQQVAGDDFPDFDILSKTLWTWRTQLPLRYEIRLAWPVHRTLVRQLPAPVNALKEPDREYYVANTTARQLNIAPSTLCLDYDISPDAEGYWVTAAPTLEVMQLCRCVRRARLNLVSLTPDASALSALIPFLPVGKKGIALWHHHHWRYASVSHWGWCESAEKEGVKEVCQRLALPPTAIAWCYPQEKAQPDMEHAFDPWRTVAHLQPPLPADTYRWAVAIALAAGSVAR